MEATPCPAFRSFRYCCEQGHPWDASLAIRTALLGTEQTQQTHCNFEVPDEISDGFLQWVTGLTDDDLNLLYRYDSTLDVVRQPAELIPCPQCGRIFKGTKGLATHCRSKHGTQVQMADTPGQTCPRCRKTFSTRSNMMYHYHHHCSQRDTSPSNPSSHQQHQQHRPNQGQFNQDLSCTQKPASTVLSLPSVVGTMSVGPMTPAKAQVAVESGGLDAFLTDTAAAVLSASHRHTGSDVDGSDKSTSANQVPVPVLSCSGRSNSSSFTPVPLAAHVQEVTNRSHNRKTPAPCQCSCPLQRLRWRFRKNRRNSHRGPRNQPAI